MTSSIPHKATVFSTFIQLMNDTWLGKFLSKLKYHHHSHLRNWIFCIYISEREENNEERTRHLIDPSLDSAPIQSQRLEGGALIVGVKIPTMKMGLKVKPTRLAQHWYVLLIIYWLKIRLYIRTE